MKKEGQHKHFNNRLIKIAWLSISLLIVLSLLILPGGNVSAQEARIVGIEYPEVVTTGTEFDVTIEVEYSFPAEGALAIDGYLGEKEIFEDMREVVGSGVLPLTYTLIAPYEPGEYEYAIDVYIWLWEFEEWEWWDEIIFFIIISKNEPPEAHAYDVPGGPAPYTARFEGWGTDDGYITRVKWDFGAGNIVEKDFGTPTIKEPGMRYSLTTTLTYNSPGIYEAIFTVWDNAHPPLSDFVTVTFKVLAKPIPPTIDAKGPYVGWEGTPITFKSIWAPGSCTMWKIAWSPGNPHIWLDDYQGTVTVTFTGKVGDKTFTVKDTASVKVKNLPPSVLYLHFEEEPPGVATPDYEWFRRRDQDFPLNFNPSAFRARTAYVGIGLMPGKPIDFKASYDDPAGYRDSPYSEIWDYGDGETDKETESRLPHYISFPQRDYGRHTYGKYGKYTVFFTVIDKDGGKATKTLSFEVVDPNLEAYVAGADWNLKADKQGLLINAGVYLVKGEVRVNGIKVGAGVGPGVEIDLHAGDGYVGLGLFGFSVKVKWPPWK